MDAMLSLLIYNPLEAMVIIGLINVFNNIKMKKADFIKSAYILGVINFSIMGLSFLIQGDFRIIVDLFVGIPLGIVTYYYYKHYLNIDTRKLSIVYTFMILMITAIMGIFLFNMIFDNSYISSVGSETFVTLYQEFFANIAARINGFIVILLIMILKK
jgi:hypothetical protein